MQEDAFRSSTNFYDQNEHNTVPAIEIDDDSKDTVEPVMPELGAPIHAEPQAPMESVNVDEQPMADSSSVKRWLHERRTTLAMVGAGALAVGSVVSLMLNGNFGEAVQAAKHDAPWAIGGIVASEAAFITGGVMMLSALGVKLGKSAVTHVRQLKKRISNTLKGMKEEGSDIAPDFSNNLLKTGFIVNALGSLGTAATVVAVAATTGPDGWGLAAPALVDIAATVGLRSAIIMASRAKRRFVS
ncbi:MAG TPA: hypothetical protein VLF91_03215 [Candidatus Saccharimonadales bacterium]|nr:hypothetical protein [Candidatus Saccharimonadales bacterium]